MLCAAMLPPDTVGPQHPETTMPRRLDHLVICVRDLAQAALDWRTLGFNLTPTGVHPFGTSNRLAMFGNNYLELLAGTSPRFCAARLVVTDLNATKRVLKDNGVDFEVAGAVLLVPSAASHGLALEFVEQETI